MYDRKFQDLENEGVPGGPLFDANQHVLRETRYRVKLTRWGITFESMLL